ncbi:unnamed protein product [Sympodiomycopsis kandeliae]
MPPRASTSAAAANADSDDDFIVADDEVDSGDDFMDGDGDDQRHFQNSRFSKRNVRPAREASKGNKKSSKSANKGAGDASKSYAWESNFQRSWDVVNEDESGSLEASVKHLLATGKRKRAAREERRVRRGIIRHLVLVIDDSENMNEKDGGRGRRIDVLLPIAKRFVAGYFEQNPIGQLAILTMRDGIAERLVPMGGNTADHLAALNNRRRLEPRGDPSLQNALEMAKSSLAHLPTTSSREVLLFSGSLTSCDPGNIHQTIASLKAANIRVDLIHLTAEMKIMRDIAFETGGTFGTALDDAHLEELVREGIRPREILKKDPVKKADPSSEQNSNQGDKDNDEEEEEEEGVAELMQMGFPLRLPSHSAPTLCACHGKLYPQSTTSSRSDNSSNKSNSVGNGFLCPRCGSKICDVPTDCPICGLTVVMSTHLARSYRHLFPVKPWRTVSWQQLSRRKTISTSCTGCDEKFPPLPREFVQNGTTDVEMTDAGSSPPPTASNGTSSQGIAQLSASSRYECTKCHNHFCLECDSYVHEELFVCPGCG